MLNRPFLWCCNTYLTYHLIPFNSMLWTGIPVAGAAAPPSFATTTDGWRQNVLLQRPSWSNDFTILFTHDAVSVEVVKTLSEKPDSTADELKILTTLAGMVQLQLADPSPAPVPQAQGPAPMQAAIPEMTYSNFSFLKCELLVHRTLEHKYVE